MKYFILIILLSSSLSSFGSPLGCMQHWIEQQMHLTTPLKMGTYHFVYKGEMIKWDSGWSNLVATFGYSVYEEHLYAQPHTAIWNFFAETRHCGCTGDFYPIADWQPKVKWGFEGMCGTL